MFPEVRRWSGIPALVLTSCRHGCRFRSAGFALHPSLGQCSEKRTAGVSSLVTTAWQSRFKTTKNKISVRKAENGLFVANLFVQFCKLKSQVNPERVLLQSAAPSRGCFQHWRCLARSGTSLRAGIPAAGALSAMEWAGGLHGGG